MHAETIQPRKADWSEVSGLALPILRMVEAQHPGGFLVHLGACFAWAFEDGGRCLFCEVDACGTMRLHALAPGQFSFAP